MNYELWKISVGFLTLSIILYSLFFIPMASAQQDRPSLDIHFPVDGQVYPVEDGIKASITTTNFTFVDFKNNRELYVANPDAGHADLWIVPAEHEGELSHDSAKKILSAGNFIKLPAMEPGEYKLVVELVRNDHSSFDPPIREEVAFRVGAPSAAAGIAGSGYKFSIAFALLLLPLFFMRNFFFSKLKKKNDVEFRI